MVRRCEPPRRRYTELCNRSGSPSSSVSRPFCAKTGNESLEETCNESLEDYWEDSSVSIRSSRSWEPSSSAWLHASGFSPALHAENGECYASPDPISRRSRSCRYSFDAGDRFSSADGRRCFPPPLASCCTLSIKGGGRFVLKEMDTDRPHGFLRAQRENGRLLLQFVLPEESSDEIAALEGDGIEVSVVDDGIVNKDEDNASAVERLEGSVASISGEVFDFQDAAQHLYEGVRNGNSDCLFGGEDVTTINGGDLLAEASKEIELAYMLPQCEGFCNGLEDAALKPLDKSAFPARQDVCKEAGTWLSGGHGGAADGGQILVPGLDQQHVTGGLREQECLWDVDPASCTLPSLSSWSPNEIYLHPPLMKIPTVYGLAMS